MTSPLVLLSRGSPLARWQAERVRARLEGAGETVELRLVESDGDRDRSTPLASMGGLGVFTKALQRELLAGRGDLAVHSLKDLPCAPVPGLVLAACLDRAPPEDVLLGPPGGLPALAPGARVGTGSPRRRALLAAFRPDLVCVEIRGNLETRRRKVQAGDVDAAVLARAGLQRLGWDDDRVAPLDPDWFVPAPAQGILGVECRSGSGAEARIRELLDDPEVRRAATAERAVLEALAAGCSTPVGALARAGAGTAMTLRAFLVVAQGVPGRWVRVEGEAPFELGREAARRLTAGPWEAPPSLE